MSSTKGTHWKSKGFSIAHVNFGSLTKNLGETYLTMNGFDIIGITETWLNERTSDNLIHFQKYNYRSFRQDRLG